MVNLWATLDKDEVAYYLREALEDRNCDNVEARVSTAILTSDPSINSDMTRVLELVILERLRQNALHGPGGGMQTHLAPNWYLIAAEEFGEVAKAIQEGFSTDSMSAYDDKVDEVIAETIQCAAVLVAMAEDLTKRRETGKLMAKATAESKSEEIKEPTNMSEFAQTFTDLIDKLEEVYTVDFEDQATGVVKGLFKAGFTTAQIHKMIEVLEENND